MSDAIAGLIRVPKMAEMLAGRIRKAIIRGELLPGAKLPSEAALISDFEVSRPTVREAIRILESEGLISVTRGARGGAKVNAATSDLVTRAAGVALQANNATMQDIYDVRTIIEPPAARLAAEVRSKASLRALRDCLTREYAQAEEGVRPTALVAEFHRILLEASGNVALAMVGHAFHDIVERHLKLSARREGMQTPDHKRTLIGLKSQERLLDLITAGEGAEAEQHWIRHMRAAGKVWLAGNAGQTVIDILD